MVRPRNYDGQVLFYQGGIDFRCQREINEENIENKVSLHYQGGHQR